MAKYSNQKLSALLKQLHDDKIVNKFTDKKKTYFYVGEVANIQQLPYKNKNQVLTKML